VRALSTLPAPVLFFGSVLVFAAIALGISWIVHRVVRPDRRETTGSTAAAYMTALGSLFAILTGFLINAEFQSLRDTENLISTEAAAATRLAWSTEGLPSADVAVIQESLAEYLGALDQLEWPALNRDRPERSRADVYLSALQSDVFNIGSRPYAPPASVEGMRAAASDMTSIRRERIARAGDTLPLGLLMLAVLAGVALVSNAIVVTLRSGRWDAVVAAGIVLIVALDLALIVGLDAPFLGPFRVSPAPIETLYHEVSAGGYLPWVEKGL
jgi:hypothetical protein